MVDLGFEGVDRIGGGREYLDVILPFKEGGEAIPFILLQKIPSEP